MNFFSIGLEDIITQENIQQNIQGFLSKKEQFSLSLVNKNFRNCIKLDQQKLDCSLEDLQKWKKSVLFPMSKKQANLNQDIKIIRTQQNTIMKMKYHKFPLQFLNSQLWEKIDGQSKILQQKLQDDKFIVENNNLFFENKQTGDIVFFNRSLLDDGLNLYKNNEIQDDNSLYENLYDQSQLNVDQFDFSDMQSMMKRQKQILDNFKQKENKNNEIGKIKIEKIQEFNQIAMILCSGGYFTLAIYDKQGKCILQKSDHKYVVRKKAGQRQLNKDKNAGSNIKSMGSQIRRDQEKHHQINVQNILTEKFSDLEKCDIIFLQAPGINRQILIQDSEPLFKLKHKLRSLCLTSKKANYTENERLYKAISKIYYIINEPNQELHQKLDQQQEQQQKKKNSKQNNKKK